MSVERISTWLRAPFGSSGGRPEPPMPVERVSTDAAPAAIGPYSQAVVANGLVFASGQIPIDPATGDLVEGDIAVQTRRVLENLKAVVEAAGSSLSQVVKATVYLSSIDDYPGMNEVYSEYFGQSCPARAAVAVAALP